MNKKIICFCEIAYILGLIILAVGTAFMEKADWGMSMVVAPAYLLHLKLQQIWPMFSFGMAEYVFQAFLLIILSLVLRQGKISYLFSFITAVVYGFTLDLAMKLVKHIPAGGTAYRCIFFSAGMILCAAGVSMLFHTYISPEAYELFVKELAAKQDWPVERVKTVYDCCSCCLGIIMSFAFFGFGHFEGVKAGTVVCALLNGWLIGHMSRTLDHFLQFKDALPFRGLFER